MRTDVSESQVAQPTARLLPVSPPEPLSTRAINSLNPPFSINSTAKSPSLIYFCRLNNAILSGMTCLSLVEVIVVFRVRDDSLVRLGSWDAARSESTTERASVIGDAHSLSVSLIPQLVIVGTHLSSALPLTRFFRLPLVTKRSLSSLRHSVMWCSFVANAVAIISTTTDTR